jgi:hypothetical protein
MVVVSVDFAEDTDAEVFTSRFTGGTQSDGLISEEAALALGQETAQTIMLRISGDTARVAKVPNSGAIGRATHPRSASH